MFKKLKGFFNWLIPTQLESKFYTYSKARVLTYIHLFLTSVIGLMCLVNVVFQHGNSVPLFFAFFFFIGLITLFKKLGNLNLSGNLLALTISLILVPSIPETGGLFSDNLLWLIVAPLIALLFTNRISSYFWMAFLFGFTIFCYSTISSSSSSQNLLIDQIKNLGPDYYLVSYLLLFVVVLLIFNFFKQDKNKLSHNFAKNKRNSNNKKKNSPKPPIPLKKKKRSLKTVMKT